MRGSEGHIAAPFTAVATAVRSPALPVAVATAVAAPDDQTVFVAALQGDLATLKSVLPARANAATPEGYTPLSLAVSAGHVEACRLLLRAGARPDAQDRAGVTALMHSVMHGFAEIAKLLPGR